MTAASTEDVDRLRSRLAKLEQEVFDLRVFVNSHKHRVFSKEVYSEQRGV